MSESAISVSIITIACVICAAMVISAIYPAVSRTISSFIISSSELSERIETSIEIITEANDTSYFYIWVKNTGSTSIAAIENTDVFFGETNNFRRIPYDAALSTSPAWNYSIENDDSDGKWDAKETLKITINQTPSSGDYYVKIVLYNAVSDEDEFSI